MKNNVYTQILFISLFLASYTIFAESTVKQYIKASEFKAFTKNEAYEKYCKRQDEEKEYIKLQQEEYENHLQQLKKYFKRDDVKDDAYEKYLKEQKKEYEHFCELQKKEYEIYLKELQKEKEKYEHYFQQQAKFYEELVKLGISAVRHLDIDEDVAESVLTTCPDEINQIIFDIKENLFRDNEKNIVLHGAFGTSKSSIAQAIAIKNQIPCLFFNTEEILTVNSGVQNLNRIFEYAKNVERTLNGQPCIIIFDDLEALTKQHIGQNNYENNNFVRFWKQLDKLKNNKIFVIGTINRTEDFPIEIRAKASMIEVPLPNLKHREAILDYYLKAERYRYKFTYPEWVSPDWMALQTEGFSHRDMQNVVMRSTKQARSNKNNDFEFSTVIEQMKNEPQRKIRTWKHAFKIHVRDPKIAIPVILGMVTLSIAKMARDQAREIAEKSRAQAKEIADYQASWSHMGKQAVCNLPGIILGAYLGSWLKS